MNATRYLKIDATGTPLPRDATDWAAVHEPTRSLMWTAADAVDAEVTHAEAEAAVAKLNESTFCGFNDWRLPTVEELFLLADRSRTDPAIDVEFFPTTASEWYWTSTPAAWSPSGCAWFVVFDDGYASYDDRDDLGRVRAVRGSARQ